MANTARSCPVRSLLWSISASGEGIVAQEVSLLSESRYVETVAVHSSHVGFAVNPLAYRVIAERLLLPE